MRKLFTLSLFTILCAFTQAQTINGTLKDDANKNLVGASVTLHKAKDSAVVKIAVSNNEGKYIFNIANNGKYFVTVSSVGFKKTASPVFDVTGSEVEVPSIALSKASKNLGEVTVTTKKQLIEVRADKTIFNVEASINAVGTDAFELLRKSPGVMIDKDDNVQLSGKNGVQIYIDGRPTPLTGKDLSGYLRSIQSSNIEAIELITNPSAKYDAAGNAGIINIRLKKNKSFGTNGSVNAGYAVGTYSKYNAGINLNNRSSKVNLFGNYNYNNSYNTNTLSIYREIYDTSFNQKGNIDTKTLSHTFKTGLDFYANKKNTFGIILDGNFTTNDMSNFGTTPTTYIPTKTGVRTLVADNSSKMHNNNINLNGNYKYVDTSGHEVNFDANYGHFDNENNQLQPNYYKDFNTNAIYDSRIYRMISPSIIDLANMKIDYEQKFNGGKLELGAKVSHVKTSNDFQRYNMQDIKLDQKTLDSARSNKFTYLEKINAAYINYNKQYKGFMVQVGLRMENSNVKGKSTGLKKDVSNNYVAYDSSFERKYTDLFPSASVTFNKNPMNQWSLSYSRRIDRPAYQNLNPFEFKLDEYTYQKGNTNLTPQYTNTFSVSNTYRYMLTTTLSYSHVKDMFAQLIDTAERSKSFITNKNLATQDIVNLSIGYPYQKGIYSAYFSLNAFYSHYKADFGAGRQIDLDATVANLYMQHSFNLGKGYKAELSAWGSTPQIAEGTLKSKSMGFVDIGLSKTIMQGKGNIKVAVSDIFKTMKWQGSSNFAGQYIDAAFRWESQQLKVNFSYRFGKTTVKAARQRATGAEDESKRVKSGSGGLGGN